MLKGSQLSERKPVIAYLDNKNKSKRKRMTAPHISDVSRRKTQNLGSCHFWSAYECWQLEIFCSEISVRGAWQAHSNLRWWSLLRWDGIAVGESLVEKFSTQYTSLRITYLSRKRISLDSLELFRQTMLGWEILLGVWINCQMKFACCSSERPGLTMSNRIAGAIRSSQLRSKIGIWLISIRHNSLAWVCFGMPTVNN